MSAAKSRRDAVAEHILKLCMTGAKRKGCRVKKLTDAGGRESVINAAAWRCVQSGAVFGNIRDYIEGNFWYEESVARDKLVALALDAERKTYIRATDRTAWKDLAPYAVAFTPVKLGPLLQPLPANSVTDVIEREEQSEEDAAADDAREQIEAEENERLREARNAYGESLEIRHRRALYLICNDPAASNSTVAAQVGMRSVKGIKPETVRKIRDKLTELADAILTTRENAVGALLREVESLKKDVAVLKAAERRRDWFLRNHTPEEFEALRAWAGPLCEALGTNVDDLLAATIISSPQRRG